MPQNLIFPHVTLTQTALAGATQVQIDITSRTSPPGNATPIIRGAPAGSRVSQWLVDNTSLIEGTGKDVAAFSDDRRNPISCPFPNNTTGHRWVIVFPAALGANTDITIEYEAQHLNEQNFKQPVLRAQKPKASTIIKKAVKRTVRRTPRRYRQATPKLPPRARRYGRGRRRYVRGLDEGWPE